ncbi:related to mRNA cap-binding protein related to eIF-4E [Ramularia collo-cygni]|uniref:Related to mRNA cap-binding protein related to eIF-4E n=1 Tax=Ramularia collo-cygni TaxID=112498 RepID=A0A2D3VEI5_9PEZI|nr:related to mRNA cap-binding protein related to eIF-4E [Ramularia collo-cygni]CZT21264.1 related to mRNA cap-binding protein related to eIF-4E [Ramularia collo-cygni]
MEKNNDNSPSNLWTRRSHKLSLSTSKPDHKDNHDSPSGKRFGAASSHGKSSPFNSVGHISTSAVASPTSAGAAFGLGSGAFASFGNAGKTPKTPGAAFDNKLGGEKKEATEEHSKDSRTRPPPRKSLSTLRRPSSAAIETVQPPSKEIVGEYPLKNAWIIYYRPTTNKNSDYEKSIKPLCRVQSVQAFWTVYSHLKRPSDLPTVSDYHIFKEGIRPVWEDEENRRGGKWIMRLKKGVADRYWEELLMAIIGDQFGEAGEEVCGAVVSMRLGEDVFSVWTKNNGGRNVKIRETIKRVLSLPADTSLQWRSHDESITQRHAVDQARQEKANHEKRRTTPATEKDGIE